MRIIVRKSNIRAFLMLCAEISSISKQDERAPFFQTAMQKMIFTLKPENEADIALVDNIDSLILACTIEADHLVCVVKQLAALLTKAVPFWIVRKNGGVAYNTASPAVKEYYPRLVQFHNSSTTDEDHKERGRLVKECQYDKIGLVDAFFESLDIYINKRAIEYRQLPLRLCKWCNDPFFGNRYDQIFCNKTHGQRWRAKGAYYAKKFVTCTDQQLNLIQLDDEGIFERSKAIPIDMRTYTNAVSGFVKFLEEPQRGEFERIWDRFQERYREKKFHYTDKSERKEKVFLVKNYLERLKSIAFRKE